MLLPKKKLIRLCIACLAIFFIVRMLRNDLPFSPDQKTENVQNFEIKKLTAEDEKLFQYLYDYIEEYRIISILDVPCSISTPWM